MNHQPFEEWLLSEKPVDPRQRLELEAHLRVCRYCSALAETGTALRTVKMVSPAPGFSARFQARLARQQALDRRRRRWGAVLFTFGGLAMLLWVLNPYLMAFLASPASWIASLVEWGIFLITTLQALAQACSVMLRVLPGVLPPFALMIVLSALAGFGLLWSVSIWRLTRQGMPRGV